MLLNIDLYLEDLIDDTHTLHCFIWNPFPRLDLLDKHNHDQLLDKHNHDHCNAT